MILVRKGKTVKIVEKSGMKRTYWRTAADYTEDAKKRMGQRGTPNAHGHSTNGYQTSTYNAWCGIKQRCLNPKDKRYYDYGGRGIKVCKRWIKFENFLADMGECPEGKSIDRIDTNGNYSPRNCKWSTPKEQQRNIRSNRWITHNNMTGILQDWADLVGLHASTIHRRLQKGYTMGEALYNPPKQERRPK